MNETVGCGKEGNQHENSLWKYPVHASLEKEGKILNGLSTTLVTKPQKFLEICLS